MLAFGDTPVLFVVRDDSDKVQENYKFIYMLYKNSCYNDVIITSTFIMLGFRGYGVKLPETE